MMAPAITVFLTMSLPARLIALRKERSLTQQQMAEALKGDSPDYFTLWESRN